MRKTGLFGGLGLLELDSVGWLRGLRGSFRPVEVESSSDILRSVFVELGAGVAFGIILVSAALGIGDGGWLGFFEFAGHLFELVHGGELVDILEAEAASGIPWSFYRGWVGQ